jgi:hypothetical protein
MRRTASTATRRASAQVNPFSDNVTWRATQPAHRSSSTHAAGACEDDGRDEHIVAFKHDEAPQFKRCGS